MTFKLTARDQRSYPVDLKTFSRLTRNERPWFVETDSGAAPMFFGVCPYCDNPLRLRGMLTAENVQPKRRPHGAHVNKRIEGFSIFDGHRLKSCPYQRRGRPYNFTERLPCSPTSLKIRQLAIEQFDRCVLVLEQDLGINLSNRLAARLLGSLLSSGFWRYPGTSLRNIPWIMSIHAPGLALKGQYLRPGSALHTIMQPELSQAGQIPVHNMYSFICLDHVAQIKADGSLEESITLLVSDFTHTSSPPAAPIVLEHKITIDHSKFERLCALPVGHRQRSQELLAIARHLDAAFPPPVLAQEAQND